MTPGARIQSAIEFLDSLEGVETPADRLLSAWFRHRRYIGSKDRKAIQAHVYGVLRQRAALDWWLAREGTDSPDGRARLIATRALADGIADFDGSTYGPAPLDEGEKRLAAALAGRPLSHPDQPAPVGGNFPDWLEPSLRRVFGDRLLEEMTALNQEAPVDLRVNSLKSDREGARVALAADGFVVEATPYSPLGLRLARKGSLNTLAAYREGLIEVQDEGSQIVAALVDARPGQRVCDLCAGAGGKTLALAATMENSGEIGARDIDADRMRPMGPRLRRAGVDIVERRSLSDADNDDIAETFDRVLVDAPCSGTGVWRRDPGARWRLSPDELTHRIETQRNILARAAKLVRPGGRLVYVTCSVLAEENAVQVENFLETHGDYTVKPVPELWRAVLPGDCPCDGPYLFLTPARHGTDGFFAAILERRS